MTKTCNFKGGAKTFYKMGFETIILVQECVVFVVYKLLLICNAQTCLQMDFNTILRLPLYLSRFSPIFLNGRQFEWKS